MATPEQAQYLHDGPAPSLIMVMRCTIVTFRGRATSVWSNMAAQELPHTYHIELHYPSPSPCRTDSSHVAVTCYKQ
ncbi:hypothetical protein GDO81_024612 [Engystomops pustulosus]|uniref:Uncharacterized protein n=1 Tax=Engystomops pustulosus TaxID=76066 RepID=A0AAV6YJL1_ENGPU|nr:hypothetical protein GDO81_024612 [Engystomops pustulosus]